MLVAELQEMEEVKGLITRGQQLGVLTFGDVASAVSEVDLTSPTLRTYMGTSRSRESSWSRTWTLPRKRQPTRCPSKPAKKVAGAKNRRST